jgi:formyltetrahydrofolate synthetase
MTLTVDERRDFVRLNIDSTTITWQRVIDTNEPPTSIKIAELHSNYRQNRDS